MKTRMSKAERKKHQEKLSETDIENLRIMLNATADVPEEGWGYTRTSEPDVDTDLDKSMKRLCAAGYVRPYKIKVRVLKLIAENVTPNRRFYVATPYGMRAIGFDEQTVKDCMQQNPG